MHAIFRFAQPPLPKIVTPPLDANSTKTVSKNVPLFLQSICTVLVPYIVFVQSFSYIIPVRCLLRISLVVGIQLILANDTKKTNRQKTHHTISHVTKCGFKGDIYMYILVVILANFHL